MIHSFVCGMKGSGNKKFWLVRTNAMETAREHQEGVSSLGKKQYGGK